jgi:hypothetical protein
VRLQGTAVAITNPAPLHAERLSRQPQLEDSIRAGQRAAASMGSQCAAGGLRHPPGFARRAEAAPLAAESGQLVFAAVAVSRAQEAVGTDAAFM